MCVYPDYPGVISFGNGGHHEGLIQPQDSEKWQSCPYGLIGDRLRISEDVTVTAINWGRYQCKHAADNSVVTRKASPELYAKIRSYKRPRLRGVNLPAAYARDVRLEITGVRVERLNEISEEDAISEGVLSIPKSVHGPLEKTGKPPLGPSPRMQFATLWESVYGPDSFDSRWVWVIEYRLIDPLVGESH